MKKVIKLTVLLLIVAISTQTYAQKFGIKAGVNFSNIYEKTDTAIKEGKDEAEGNKMLIGYNAGLTGEFDINDNVAIGAGLIFNTKGTKLSHEQDILGTKYEFIKKMNMLYLDIPIYAKGKYTINDGTNIYATFGPYIGVGLTGKHKVKIEKDGKEVENATKVLESLKLSDTDVKWGSDASKGEYKRLDYGLQFGLGAEFNNFFVEASYKLGLADIDNIEKNDTVKYDHKTKHGVIGVSVGYNFGF